MDSKIDFLIGEDQNGFYITQNLFNILSPHFTNLARFNQLNQTVTSNVNKIKKVQNTVDSNQNLIRELTEGFDNLKGTKKKLKEFINFAEKQLSTIKPENRDNNKILTSMIDKLKEDNVDLKEIQKMVEMLTIDKDQILRIQEVYDMLYLEEKKDSTDLIKQIQAARRHYKYGEDEFLKENKELKKQLEEKDKEIEANRKIIEEYESQFNGEEESEIPYEETGSPEDEELFS